MFLELISPTSFEGRFLLRTLCAGFQHLTIFIMNLAVNVEFLQDLDDIAGGSPFAPEELAPSSCKLHFLRFLGERDRYAAGFAFRIANQWRRSCGVSRFLNRSRWNKFGKPSRR